MSLLRRVQQKNLNLEQHRGSAGVCRVASCSNQIEVRGNYLCNFHRAELKRLDLSKRKLSPR